MADRVALIKPQPDKFNRGSNGNGTAQHRIGTPIQNLTGTQWVHSPWKGSGTLALAADQRLPLPSAA